MSASEIELESAVDKVLHVINEERLTIREAHIVLGRATRRLLEMDLTFSRLKREDGVRS